ncbi:MAG: class I SAM-dependent methyltransferase [Flavobacteriales bacterium]|nr:class I SAM-dependent methyltransferase [Flavobacteriales bacterium]
MSSLIRTTGKEARPNPRADPRWVAARFDRIARSYGLFERLFMVPGQCRKRAVERLGIREGHRILDVGIGHGPQLLAISTPAGDQGRVVGVDLSTGMLDRARDRIREHDLWNVELRHMNILDHHPIEPYDAVLLSFALSSFGEPARVLDHVWRCIRPGGRLVVLDAQIPPTLKWITRPLMPAIRWFLERTVLGDPDMRPLEHLADLGGHMEVEWFRGRTYFVACIGKLR